MYACFVYLSCCLVVFKQKTAYELRISDWSSDVCSSDLWSLVAAERGALSATLRQALSATRQRGQLRTTLASANARLLETRAGPSSESQQIVRASRRERVGQYGESSVDAVALKQTTSTYSNRQMSDF